MADTKVSALTAVTAAVAASELPVNESGTSKKITLQQIAEFVSAQSLIRQAAAYTLSNVATQQKLFNASTNGALTLPTGTYLFDAAISVSAMSATSGNAAFSIKGGGTAVLAAVLYSSVGADGATATAGTQTGSTTVATTGTSAASIATAGTGTGLQMNISGTFEVTTAGTIIPSITLVTAAAAVVAAGSFLRVERIGAAGLATVGAWS